MKPTLLCMLLSALLSACVSVKTGDEAAFDQLTDKKLDELDSKLRRWSEARNRDDGILEAVLYRDLRREAGRLSGGLKLAIASSDMEKRAICAACLGFTEDTGAVGLLVELLRDSEATVRANAMLALCLLRSQKVPAPEIVARLQDEDAIVRRLAVLCLRNLYDPATTPDLFLRFVEAMRDADPGVRINATAVLEELGEVRAAPFLARPGLTDDSAQVRRNAAVGLGRLRVPDTAEPLVRALDKEMNPSVRKEIITALKNITGKDAGETAAAWDQALHEKPKPPEEPTPPADREKEKPKK